jgi:uncharacterized repeat protein (TIGR01451 family)
MFGRITRGSVAAATLVVGAVVSFTPLVTSAGAAPVSSIPSNYFTVVDTGGVNDENGGSQLELTQMGRDDTAAGFYQLFWSWDGIDFQSQTGDACALFDSDGDANIDFDICAQIESSGGSVTQTNVSPTAHTCGDAKNDRCTTPGDVTPGAGQLVAGPIENLSDTNGDLVTATDPFAGQVGADASPNDSTIAVKIAKSLLPGGAQLVNVCDYESIAGGGNNNPNDCIVNPGGGFLSIVKETSGGDGTFDFDLTNADNTPSSFSRSITTVGGTGTADPAAVIIGTATAVTEDVPAGWLLDGAACTLQGGSSTGSYDASTGSISDVEVESGSVTTCTFSNTKAAPELSLDKSADVSTYDAVGDVISYTYVLTNTGNVTLDAPYTVDDDVIDGSGGSVDCPATPATLAHGDSVTCTATYTVTQDDIDAGQVHNTAQGHASFGDDPVDSNTDDVVVTADQQPALSLDKSSADESFDTAGQTLTYSYELTNTGNVTLAAPYTVDDDVVNGAGGSVDCPDTPATLAPGDPAIVCTATYDATQADLDAGLVLNTAQGHATHGEGTVDSNRDSVEIPADQQASLQVVKAVDVESAEYGDTLTYTLQVRNTGNVTLHGVVVTDEVPAHSTYVAGSAAPKSIADYDAATDTVSWAVGDLAVGGTKDGLTFQVTIDVPEYDPEVGIPARVIDNVAVGRSDAVEPAPSNHVRVPVTAVLGIEVHRRPPTVLPFTGEPLSPMSGIALGLLAVVAGVLSLSATSRRGRRA